MFSSQTSHLTWLAISLLVSLSTEILALGAQHEHVGVHFCLSASNSCTDIEQQSCYVAWMRCSAATQATSPCLCHLRGRALHPAHDNVIAYQATCSISKHHLMHKPQGARNKRQIAKTMHRSIRNNTCDLKQGNTPRV
jgi:hypothetical protein